MPDLDNLKDLRQIFPNLSITDIPENEPLKKVNDFEPNEISYKIGTLEFTEKKSVNLYLNLWYSSTGDGSNLPLIVEFTFDYEAKKQSEGDGTLLEEFPHSLVRRTSNFYHLLQDKKIADLDTSKTKTEFAYKPR